MPAKDRSEELRKLSEHELQAKLEVLHEEMFNLRFQSASHQNQNPKRIRAVRRTIARILSIQNERKRKAS